MKTTYRYDLLLPLPQSRFYTYESHHPIDIGQIVLVPFGKRQLPAVIWAQAPDDTTYAFDLKAIEDIYPLPPLTPSLLKLIEWTSKYYMAPLGNCLKMVLTGLPDIDHAPRKKYGTFPNPHDTPREFPLTPQQAAATQSIKGAIQSHQFQPFLLDGVTGSGKTEVYYESLLDALRMEHQVLILLPEIGLTQQWLERFKHRFGVEPARWHSSLKQSERLHTWQQVAKGLAPVIVGARSALFLPFQSLGLIVVDEEHDGSYKQEEGIHYHARDVAVVRAQLESCPVVLASATPSVESIVNAQDGRYAYLSLTERFGSAGHPTAHIIDLRHKTEGISKGKYISNSLTTAIQSAIDNHEQVILFLNRRGYAPLTVCTSCGHTMDCTSCSAHLVHHKGTHGTKNNLQCHHCGISLPIPKECPNCHTPSLTDWGIGIERLSQEVARTFPDARTLTVSSDHLSNETQAQDLYHALHHHQVDIVIGTQMMAKGHDFSNVTLVGIIDADGGLMAQDMRAGENAYQLLHQVAGRCGRGDKPGHVYIQTFNPEHPVIQALKTFDRDDFLNLEIHNRQLSNLPPFSRQAAIIVSGTSEEEVKSLCHSLMKRIPPADYLHVFGPAPALLARLRGKFRYRFLIQTGKEQRIQPWLQQWLTTIDIPRHIQLTIDIDPISFF